MNFTVAGNVCCCINKLEACLELNRIGGDHHVHWNYHEDVFSRALWTHEPPDDIEELYRQRALQLREQYDHLVLFYSGGADSTTILQAFIKNNIKLDLLFGIISFFVFNNYYSSNESSEGQRN